MTTKRRFEAVFVSAVLTALMGCGGGGESGSGSTASDAQTRTEFSPDSAIDFVKSASREAKDVLRYANYFNLVAARPTGAAGVVPKDVGMASCRVISDDPNCQGTLLCRRK